MKKEDWPFSDPQNVAVIANRSVVAGGSWIAHVSHDEDDGAWQFHTQQANDVTTADAVVVSLRSIWELDPSIAELANLPLGWHAWRKSKDAPWVCSKS